MRVCPRENQPNNSLAVVHTPRRSDKVRVGSVGSLRLVLLHGRVHLLLAALRLHDAVLLVAGSAGGGGGRRRGAARVLVLVGVVALGGVALRVPVTHALAVAVRVLLLRRLRLRRRQA